jgi:hypothetical protein
MFTSYRRIRTMLLEKSAIFCILGRMNVWKCTCHIYILRRFYLICEGNVRFASLGIVLVLSILSIAYLFWLLLAFDGLCFIFLNVSLNQFWAISQRLWLLPMSNFWKLSKTSNYGNKRIFTTEWIGENSLWWHLQPIITLCNHNLVLIHANKNNCGIYIW